MSRTRLKHTKKHPRSQSFFEPTTSADPVLLTRILFRSLATNTSTPTRCHYSGEKKCQSVARSPPLEMISSPVNPFVSHMNHLPHSKKSYKALVNFIVTNKMPIPKITRNPQICPSSAVNTPQNKQYGNDISCCIPHYRSANYKHCILSRGCTHLIPAHWCSRRRSFGSNESFYHCTYV